MNFVLDSKIKMISFDAGGTLLSPYPSVGEIYSRVAKKYDRLISPLEINQSFHRVWQKKDMHDLISHSDEKIEKTWWGEIVKEVFVPFEAFDDFDLFFNDLFDYFASPDCWRLFPETIETLEILNQKGIRMCVISNWDSRLVTLCRSFEIEKYFEFILISAVFGVSKPHPKIFEEACRKAHLLPNEILHVGDSLEDDVQGAMRSGLHTVFLDRHARSEDATFKEKKCHCISDLRTLSMFS
jgi:putative hydrolase of the HAD superfamily